MIGGAWKYVVRGLPPTVSLAISMASANVEAVRKPMRDALEMAKDSVGSSPSITYFHAPPVMIADVH